MLKVLLAAILVGLCLADTKRINEDQVKKKPSIRYFLILPSIQTINVSPASMGLTVYLLFQWSVLPRFSVQQTLCSKNTVEKECAATRILHFQL
jgi:hypothetical protein